MFKVRRISLVFPCFSLFLPFGCTSMELTEVNQKVGHADIIMVTPDQDCSEKNGDKILLKEEIAHNNAKICYYG